MNLKARKCLSQAGTVRVSVTPPPQNSPFLSVYSIFASLSLLKLCLLLININGWSLPVWTSNPDHPFSAPLTIPAGQWHLIGTPAALDWSSELSGLTGEAHPQSGLTHLIVRPHRWHLASSPFCLCPQPPSRRHLLRNVYLASASLNTGVSY